MKSKTIQPLIVLLLIVLLGCQTEKKENDVIVEKPTIQEDPLPSWKTGDTKASIIAFVEKVSTPGPDFVPVEDRIATFDNDGNLWAEQPAYFQLFFAVDQVKAMAKDHPEWETEEPFKSVLNNDMEGLMASGEHGILELIMASHAGMPGETYKENVANWLQNTNHPRFDQPYNKMTYQPMLELLDYLRANEFTTFIVSGGGIDFMRVWATEAYGIPTHQIIGSSIDAKFEYIDGEAKIIKEPKINFIDDKAGKPVGIYNHIGKKPIFASGNSDGDLQMLQYTDSNAYPSFQLYLHHTDADREWAYDRNSHIGRLDKGLDEAMAKGWTVIDMKNDWKTVFPFQQN
jgi:phosphoglycolate phosphatase-like HAD superfamily hydrolase